MSLIKQINKPIVKSNIRNGNGEVKIFQAFSANEQSPITFAARLELDPGASIGFHLHDCDEESYSIVSGKGIYEFDGGQCPALPGDIFVTKLGMSHGLRNTGDAPLVFFAVVGRK